MRIIDTWAPALTLAVAVHLGGCSRGGQEGSAASAPEKASSAETDTEPRVSRDTNGNVAITVSAKVQGEMGLSSRKPEAAVVSPEVKGYGRVLDPAPLVALMNELASATATYTTSSNELARLKTLTGQGNASERALQLAEATAVREQLAVESARVRLAFSWGKIPGDQTDVPAFIQGLTAREMVLVRIDLPVGDGLSSSPTGARITTLSGGSLPAAFLSAAPDVDPQMQGRGFIFRLSPNRYGLAPGEAVAGYLEVHGATLTGVIIPREAVVHLLAATRAGILSR